MPLKSGAQMAEKEFLRSLPLFSGCTIAQLEWLAGFIRTVSCTRHQELYREGTPSEHIHIIAKGEVVLEKERGDGEDPMRLAIVREKEYFGLGEVMLAHYYTTATALTDCSLLQIDNRDFKKHFLAIESIRDKVMTQLSEIARYLLFSVAAGSGGNMLALYLRHLARENGKEVDGKIHIQAKVLQPQIASLLNMSREHVTRLFARLQGQGVVNFNQGYPIVDKQWLQDTVTDPDLADFIVYRDYPQS
jgi:CRP-like cAMP-binding protein